MSAAATTSKGWDSPLRRGLMLFAAMFLIVVVVGVTQGTASMLLILVQATAFALIALGLNIQWGYGGLFNFAIMGFLMVGGASTVFLSYPVNPEFWNSDGPMMLGRALLGMIYRLEDLFPHASARLGRYPMIVIRKRAGRLTGAAAPASRRSTEIEHSMGR